jgi:antitoxin PrlF
MTKATVTSRGRITLPIVVRDALGLKTGTRIEFIEIDKGKFMLVPAVHSIESLKELLHKPSKPDT